jgi:hypothetical protein
MVISYSRSGQGTTLSGKEEKALTWGLRLLEIDELLSRFVPHSAAFEVVLAKLGVKEPLEFALALGKLLFQSVAFN